MPIHVRAEPGDYAEACLLPGDPLRAQYIAETYLDSPVQRNSERGMLGYTGEFEGKPVSVQATGMGCPSAAIVTEELVQLGVKRLIRVGTCGGLQPDLELGDLIVALTAVPADRTVETYVNHEPHCPTADWELIHFTPEEFIADGDRVVVLSSVAFRFRATGKVAESPKADVFRFRDGKIVEFFEFFDTARAFAATRADDPAGQ